MREDQRGVLTRTLTPVLIKTLLRRYADIARARQRLVAHSRKLAWRVQDAVSYLQNVSVLRCVPAIAHMCTVHVDRVPRTQSAVLHRIE